MGVLLVLSMLFTSVPIQVFAAEAPVPRIPVSAPLEQPEPVTYEAQQQTADESAGASASTPDSTPAESAPPVSSSASQAASSSQSASAETPENSSVPSSGSNAQPSGDSSTAPESVSTPDASSSVSESAGISTSTSEVNSEEDSSSSVETSAEETPEEPPVELRAPILREKYDPYAEKYGSPVEVSEYARVFSAPSANLFRAARGSAACKEYITVISPVPNTYVDENGQEHAIDNTLVVEDKNGVPTYTTTSAYDALGNATAYEYNTAGLPTKQTCPDGSSMLLEYDVMGRLAQYTDLLGLVTTLFYGIA